ncbi:MAG: RNA 3'-terminal phosphate cyclase [Candidatus Micrarchaeota archaeon]
MIEIRGDEGEGGGQILRSSIALSCILGAPIRITGIRARRPKPGMQLQHLTGVSAAASISDAHVEGLVKGSKELVFEPRGIMPGAYSFDVGTAGSVTLVLQTLLPIFCFSKGKCSARITGGTHVAWSPTAHYMEFVLLPTLARMGFRAKFEIKKFGWYPAGGGEVFVETEPTNSLKPFAPKERGALKRVFGVSCASNLPPHVVERQVVGAKRVFPDAGVVCDSREALCPGSAVTICAEFENTVLGTSSLGAIGKRAEKVGEEAANELKKEMGSAALVDKHCGDQLLIYMALARGYSSVRVSEITAHMRTNVGLIEQMAGVMFDIDEKERKISIEGAGIVR